MRTSRAAALQVVRDEPQEVLDRARAATSAAAEALAAAVAKEAEIVAAFDADDSLAQQAVDARVRREKAERVHAKRATEEAAALAAVEQAERARVNAELDKAIAFLGSLDYSAELEQLVEIDRQVSKLVDALADRVLEASDVHATAVGLGERVGRSIDVQRSARSPSMGWLQLLGRVAIARAREAEGRDAVDGWIQAERVPVWNDLNRPVYDAAVAAVANMKGAR